MTHIRPLLPAKSGIMTREEKKRSYPQSDRFNRHSWLDSMWGRDASNIRGDYCRESCPLFRVLRYRTPSSPIHLSEVTEQALRLIASIPLIQRREKHRSREEKSAFTEWFFCIYVRSLKDQARKSKYPRT